MLKINDKEIDAKSLMKIIFIILFSTIIFIFLFLNIKNIAEFAKKIVSILMAIIYGLIMTYLMSPLYNRIVDKLTKPKNGSNSSLSEKAKKKKLGFAKAIATAACVLTVLVIVIGLIALVIPQLVSSIYNFIVDFSNYPDKISSYFNAQKDLDISLVDKMTVSVNDLMEDLYQLISKTVVPRLNTLAVNFSKGAMHTFKQILNFFIGVIVMIYVLNMKTEVLNAFKKSFYALFSEKTADKIIEECRFAHKVFSGFLVGKLVDSLIIGILCFICCSLMKMPYTLLVSVIVGVTNIIPFFGPFIGAIPSFVFIVLVDPVKGLVFLVFILILQQFDGNILGPYILGDKTGVKSFYVLFSILLFGGLFGFVGMIIGVPLWAVISRLFWELMDSKLRKKKLSTNVEDYSDK